MAKRRFEFVDGSSSKFWEIEGDGDAVTVTFGKLGTAGSAKDKTHASADAAAREVEKLIAEKTKKGYVEVGASPPVKKRAEAAAPLKPAAGPLGDAFFSALDKKHKALVKSLRPAASTEALQTLGKLAVPGALLALYARHDGGSDPLYGSYRWLSAEEILAERKTMNGLLSERTDWRESGRWNAAWVPFLSDGDGQLFAFDPVGGTDGGPAGQIVGFDHETGPARAFASFDVMLGLLSDLAKKGLLGESGRENAEEAFEELVAKAEAVGLARMAPKELKKVLASLDEGGVTTAKKLELALPLAKQFGAERELWQVVSSAAQDLEDWKLMLQAATAVDKLTAKRDRPHWESSLCLALHRCGRDKEALGVLRGALQTNTNYPDSQIPQQASPEFLRRAYAVATEERPKDYDLWLARGMRAVDPAERKACFEQCVVLSKDAKLTPFAEDRKKKAGYAASRQIEVDRIETLELKDKHAALLVLSKKKDESECADTWQRLCESALAMKDWATLAKAGAKREACEAMDYKKYAHAHFQIRALYEQGKDKAALAHLETRGADMYNADEDDALLALPFGHPAKRAADAALDAEAKAFELAALRVLTKCEGAKAEVWYQRALAEPDPAERRSAHERIVAIAEDPDAEYHPSPNSTTAHNERGLRLYRELQELGALAKKALAKRD